MSFIIFINILCIVCENPYSTKADPLLKAGQGVTSTLALNVVTHCSRKAAEMGKDREKWKSPKSSKRCKHLYGDMQ